jgi:aldehyde:ferredoxin oxidoreductase
MAKEIFGYCGKVLEVDLSTGKINKLALSEEDAFNFIGGRGLGIKFLWDRIKEANLDALSPKNPLMFLPGPFSGFPISAASRTCVVTKSALTSSLKSKYRFASTISYSNMGGFFGPEIKFAGYDGIIITGQASSPVYLYIDDDKVEVRDAKRFWGMKINEFDKAIAQEVGSGFETCYIGPAGENLVRYASILHTPARAAGRGGVGCVMGSKRLKAITIRGKNMPKVAHHKRFLEILEGVRTSILKHQATRQWRRYGTAAALISSSDAGSQAVKNYREGTFLEVDKIGGVATERKLWVRDEACYCCPLACHKVGVVREGPYAGIYHDGPEYETGTMLGANLLVSDLFGLMREIADVDDYGVDQISTGNTIGFLMEAYERGYIDQKFLDDIDLKWGDVEAVLKMIKKIAYREGIGDLASKGVKALAAKIGGDSHKFAIHCKGQELAAWNVHVTPTQALCYVTSNRGACHLNSHSAKEQNIRAIEDSLGYCLFAREGLGEEAIVNLLCAITGYDWTFESGLKTGERIFNLEKCFNFREGFRREDDVLPARFFEEPLTIGPKKGAVLEYKGFRQMMDNYYLERGWDLKTTKPSKERLSSLGLDFAFLEVKGL